MYIKSISFALLILNSSPAAFADSFENGTSSLFHRVQAHAGKMDTDGILSEGELRNPRIDYDREQRQAHRENDNRLDNQYNEDAARDARGQKDWEKDREDNYDRRQRSNRDQDQRQERSWWDW